MDMQTTNRQIGLMTTIYDDFDERPVDCDFVLPDFLPDIAAILKCTLHPVVQTYQMSGDRVSANGMVRIHLLYLDEERRCIRCFEHTQPFSSEFTVKGLSVDSVITLCATTNYVNCRATGPRRVDVHGAFSVKLTVVSCQEHTVVETVQGSHVHAKTSRISYTVPTVGAVKTFTVNEVKELEGEGAVQSIVRYDARVCVYDWKQMAGKAVVKGDVLLTTIYVTDAATGELQCAKYSIPFSQILDVDGMQETVLCDYRAELLSVDVQPVPNPNGENRLLSVSVKIAMHAQCYQHDTCEMVCDAFHTQYPLHTSVCRLDIPYLSGIRQESLTVRQSVALPDAHVKQVLDVWCSPVVIQQTNDTVFGRSTVSLLARDDNGLVLYFERPLECELPLKVGTHDSVNATITDLEYAVSGDHLDLRLPMLVKAYTLDTQCAQTMTELQIQENSPYSCAEGMELCQAKVVFAKAGDSVWEIAKAEHVSPVAIAYENELDADVVSERTALLIPLR